MIGVNIQNDDNNKSGPTEVTLPISPIPVYREDVMKRFYETFLEKIEETKESVKEKINLRIIKNSGKQNTFAKMTIGELHQKNMIIYYIIPLVYLVYSYVYIKFSKQQNLRLMYSESKLSFKMFTFLFDRRNPIIKKVNVCLHERFKLDEKKEAENDKKLLPVILESKTKMIDFLEFVDEQITKENDYTAEHKRIEDIIENLGVIKKYFDESSEENNKSIDRKEKIISLEEEIISNTENLKKEQNTTQRNIISKKLRLKKRNLDELKRLHLQSGGKLNKLSNLVSNDINIKLRKRFRKTYNNILDEMQKTNLLIIGLDTTSKLLVSELNKEDIRAMTDEFQSKLGEIEEKKNAQEENKKHIKSLIQLLNFDKDLLNDLYAELFSPSSNMKKDTKERYKKLLTEQLKKYFDIIKLFLYKNIAESLNKFAAVLQININGITKINDAQNNKTIEKLFYIFLNIILIYKFIETIYILTLLSNTIKLSDEFIKYIKNLQDKFNDTFRDYKTKSIDNDSKITTLENMKKKIDSSLKETSRELISIESNMATYNRNNQDRINGKDGLTKIIDDKKKSLKSAYEDISKGYCKDFKLFEPIYSKIQIQSDNSEIDTIIKQLEKLDKDLISKLEASLKSQFTWTTQGSSPTKKKEKYDDIYLYLKNIYDKKENDINELEEAIKLLEYEKNMLQSRIDKRKDEKNTLTLQKTNLEELKSKIEERLTKLQSKNSSLLPNFSLIQKRFTDIFKVTLTISEKYKEYAGVLAFNKSKNKVYFLYTENQDIFNIKYGGILKKLNSIRNKDTHVSNLCTLIDDLTNGLTKSMIGDKSGKFMKDLEKYFKDTSPVARPFLDEYKIYYEELFKKILIILHKISKKEMKRKENPSLEDIKRDYIKHITRKNKIRDKIFNMLQNHYEMKDAENLNKKEPFIIVAPYTYVLFLYFIDLLLIIDYLTFFYE